MGLWAWQVDSGQEARLFAYTCLHRAVRMGGVRMFRFRAVFFLVRTFRISIAPVRGQRAKQFTKTPFARASCQRAMPPKAERHVCPCVMMPAHTGRVKVRDGAYACAVPGYA